MKLLAIGAWRNGLVGKVASMTGLHVVNGLIPLITLSYLVRVLGLEEFGRISFALAINQFLMLLSEYGFTLSASRDAARHRAELAYIGHLFRVVQSTKLVLVVVCFLILAGLVAWVPAISEVGALAFIGFGTVVGYFMTPTWLFLGMGKMDRLVIFTIVPRILSVPFVFLWVKGAQHGNLALVAQTWPVLFTGVLGSAYAWKQGWLQRGRDSTLTIRSQVAAGWPLFVSSLSTSLYTSCPTVFLGFFSNHAAVGTFSAAQKLVVAMQSWITPVSQVIFPRVNSLMDHDAVAAIQTMRRVLLIVAAANLTIFAGLFIFAPMIVSIAYSDAGAETVTVVRLLSPLVFIIGVSSMLGTNVMLTLGLSRQFSYGTLLGGGVILATLPWLSRSYAAHGAAVALTLAELSIFSFFAWTLHRTPVGGFLDGTPGSMLRFLARGEDRQIAATSETADLRRE